MSTFVTRNLKTVVKRAAVTLSNWCKVFFSFHANVWMDRLSHVGRQIYVLYDIATRVDHTLRIFEMRKRGCLMKTVQNRYRWLKGNAILYYETSTHFIL